MRRLYTKFISRANAIFHKDSSNLTHKVTIKDKLLATVYLTIANYILKIRLRKEAELIKANDYDRVGVNNWAEFSVAGNSCSNDRFEEIFG